MFKKIISAVIAITMVMGMCSCGEQSSSVSDKPGVTASGSKEPSSVVKSEPEPIPDTGRDSIELTANYEFSQAAHDKKNDADFIKGIGSFSAELFKNAVKGDLAQGKNTLVSPESVAFALGMTMNGASGETLTQMQNVLCSGVELDKFNSNMNLLISKAHSSNTEDSKLSIANSIWVKDDDSLTPTEQFTKNCKQLYNAEFFRAPFDSKTVEKLNGWVDEKTDSMIKKLIDRFEGDEIMCLVNCIAFDSKWEKQYEDNQVKEDQDFTNAQEEKVKCTMLSCKEDTYVENGRATGFVKLYKGGKYAFMAVLPNENTTINNYVCSMSSDELLKLYEERTDKYTVYTRLPEFTYDHSTELNSTLKQMGMKDAFGAADFSNMFKSTPAAINRVIHKTHIELNAKGTKAAAATAVTMRKNDVAVEDNVKRVILDRPFLYAIMDTETGLPVFIGTVCDPTVK